MLMIGPGIFVISINSAHSNEVLEVNAIIEGNRYRDTEYQKRWNRTDFRIAEDQEVVMNLRKKMCRPKYEWSLFPEWANWAYIQPNGNLLLSSHRPDGFTMEHGFYFSNPDNSHQILEVKDSGYRTQSSSSSLDHRPVNILAEIA